MLELVLLSALPLAFGLGILGKKKHFMSLKLDNERNASARNSVLRMNKLMSDCFYLNGRAHSENFDACGHRAKWCFAINSSQLIRLAGGLHLEIVVVWV